MRGRVRFCCLVMILHVVSWAGVTSRSFAPNDGRGVPLPQPDKEQSPESLQVSWTMAGVERMKEQGGRGGGKISKGVNKIGSSPPSCEDKCFGCIPCEAIQVPTTTSPIGVQYTNYEPEGWKCKCGPSFYAP